MADSNIDPRRRENPIPLSRRRDKPQLSCNLCRRRKLKCDRNSPCGSCIRRGLSLSCVYPQRNMDANNASQKTQANMSDRISQLENLVMTMMGSRNGGEEFAPEPATPVTTDLSEDKNTTHLPDAFGRIVLDGSKTTYVESGHWTAILDGIAELKNSFENDHEQNIHHELPNPTEDAHRPAILFGSYRSASREELLAAIPPRPVVDRLVTYFLQYDLMANSIIHGPTFMKQYEQFWTRPFQTPIIWVGQLFAIISLASCQRDRRAPAPPESLRFEQTYCERIVQCLVLGNYSQGPPYTLETFLLYLDIKYIHYEANQAETWFVLGLIVRLALRMGYHRDPSHFPNISPFDAEMRRRTWAYIVQHDILMSGHVGLPRMINEDQADTTDPRNLLDEDFDRDTLTLPPPQPDTIVSHAMFLVCKKRVASVYGMIRDLTTSPKPIPYHEVQRLQTRLDESYASVPSILILKTTSISPSDTPQLILRRLILAILVQSSKCILHYKHMILGRTDNRYAASLSSCLEAAVEVLRCQKLLYDQVEPGGILHGFLWKISSLLKSGFYLAATLLCLNINLEETSAVAKGVITDDQRDRIIQALYNAYTIWTQSGGISRESVKISDTLLGVLQKVQKMGITSILLDKELPGRAVLTCDEWPRLPDESMPLNSMDTKQSVSSSNEDTYTNSFLSEDIWSPMFMQPGGNDQSQGINEQGHNRLSDSSPSNMLDFQLEDLLSMDNGIHPDHDSWRFGGDLN